MEAFELSIIKLYIIINRADIKKQWVVKFCLMTHCMGKTDFRTLKLFLIPME